MIPSFSVSITCLVHVRACRLSGPPCKMDPGIPREEEFGKGNFFIVFAWTNMYMSMTVSLRMCECVCV